MLVQNKVPKQKDTPCRLFPALLAKAGGCGTRTFSAQTVLAENSRFVCDVPVLGMSAKCPFLRHDLGAIGAAAGDLRSKANHANAAVVGAQFIARKKCYAI